MDRAEIELMSRLQGRLGAGRAVALARLLSAWGEHAGGWLLLGVAGAALDRRRRDLWVTLLVSASSAHAAAVLVKKVVRRRRPADPALRTLVRTPSNLSFPSAHSASTTAAALTLAPLVGRPVAAGVIGAMAIGRVLLGVHYPTDVAAGVVLGAAAERGARIWLRRRSTPTGSPPWAAR